MLNITLTEISKLLNQASIDNDDKQAVHGMSIDTRTLQPGNLYVAIKGERFDGHDFIHEAYKKGAIAAIVNRKVDSKLRHFVVTDTTFALGAIGTAWRQKFAIPFIAVTGSNGKTTLKNMIAAIMVAACQDVKTHVLASHGNLNNQWGLPLTLTRLSKHHRYAVIEMGMNHFGEIDYLTKMACPHVAVITNAAAAHLEGVGNLEGVAKAKAEIFAGLPDDGVAILNRDDAFFTYWREHIGSKQYSTFGFHPDADISGTLLDSAPQQIQVKTPKGSMDLHIPLLGQHNVLNSLAAVAATLAIGIELAQIKQGLESIQPAHGRLQMHTLHNRTMTKFIVGQCVVT